MSNLIRNWVNPIFSALDFDNFPSSIANLPAALTINGITVLPSFRYKGEDATDSVWPAWGYGGNLSIAGSGTDPTNNDGSPLLGDIDSAVTFPVTGKYYLADSVATGDISTTDVVWIVLSSLPKTALRHLTTKLKTTANFQGWDLGESSGSLYLRLINDGLQQASATGPVIGNGAWALHFVCYRHSDLKARIWTNGTWGTENGIFANTKTSPAAMTIGAYNVDGTSSDNSCIFIAQYQSASWFAAGEGGWTQIGVVANELYAKLCGIYPQKALGTALPSVVTRSTAGYLDRVPIIVGESEKPSLYYMGPNWPRVCSRKDTYGVEQRGYLSETSSQNICLQSQTFATTWAPVYASVPTTAVLCPDGVTRTTSTIHEDATAGQAHYVWQSGITLAASTTYCISVFAKQANRSWIKLGVSSSNGFFNLDSGTIGTVTSATAGIIPYGNGWYRCYFAMASGGGGSIGNYIIPCEADNDQVFDGLNQDSLYIFGAQVEVGSYPSSYVSTTTAAVTRSADALRYVATNNVATGMGSCQIDILGPNRSTSDLPYLITIDDATNLNRVEVYSAATTGVSTLNIRNIDAVQATIAGTKNLYDGNKHTILATWKNNSAKQYVDKVVDGAEDTTVVVPIGLTQVEVGSYRTTGSESNALISKVKISK